ncbi:class I SAM-dependent RNA methyltransferase [Aristophania vespae]|uniref:Class I SAM-dependent RNA methyltransferase n=1 Tax=Aristophania vespae TaxID=2697033 RepID=A0A6P1NDZ0_9PROT|nr:class I SAM-dependent RNA methyltransferase [Aristophania vespae]QHI95698.1 class I SAM-dependent RNA methyltransferase [Aristophania vespae]
MTINKSQNWHVIERLGSSGDGACLIDGTLHYVPGVLPGEKVRLSFDGHIKSILELQNASPDRATPSCSLFGLCGGCSLQHVSLPALLKWKTERIVAALKQVGFTNLPDAEQFQSQPKTRRRMDFALQRIDGGIILGLHQRAGNPVNMTECSLLHPDLFKLLDPLRECLAQIGALTGSGGLFVNLLDTGPDLLLEIPAQLSSSDKAKLADFARQANIARISWRSKLGDEPETIVQWKPVFHHFGSVKVAIPPGAFLQVSQDAENALVSAVLKGLPSFNKKDIAHELYAGNGTFSFALGERTRVFAYEGSKDAFEALKLASHGTRVEAHHRDLKRQPLLPQDLKTSRVVILDPPFVGAGKQMDFLAQSAVKDVIYVSCNPNILIKDLMPLQKSGFEVLQVSVIDQFLWSADTETVVTLTRDQKRLKKARKNAC